eukprot:3082806-Prymnesium_polylepis.1
MESRVADMVESVELPYRTSLPGWGLMLQMQRVFVSSNGRVTGTNGQSECPNSSKNLTQNKGFVLLPSYATHPASRPLGCI